ncbi:toll/interleukin-1 receptor domain-containing protein [Enterococcus sp. BWM-S5]|uniref:Toll/interleukin-1 receptor domain-containing protein n=1 Tax=Enterococcus larvae TaxID=2794352 RepID=A0ABS4CPA1_9ENTE|nr:toll/interleukin-1 receptor domain-containing protein [Enterococcus larvae]MBP1047604.1 toll/interleukin-1 receptor domain-containing protein [Enterococcus larvae]
MRRKVFISHCNKDKKYSDIFAELLKIFGFRNEDIFYSSKVETGVNPGELIFDRLKKELKDEPIVLYFLSNNYYRSVPCLNEMGASWVMTDEHYPVALPNFSHKDIKGALDSNHLMLMLNTQLDVTEIFKLMKQICEAAEVEIPLEVAFNSSKYIQPLFEKLEELIYLSNFLLPDENGFFETVLGEERDIGDRKEISYCFKLAKPVAEKYIGLAKFKNQDDNFLFFDKEGEYQVGDRVRFKLKDKGKLCRMKDYPRKLIDIYISSIERIVDEEREVQG